MNTDHPKRLRPFASRSTVLGFTAVLATVLAIASGVTAEERAPAPPGAGSATDAELQVLRRLLGLPASSEQPAATPQATDDAGAEVEQAPAVERSRAPPTPIFAVGGEADACGSPSNGARTPASNFLDG